MMVPCAEHGCLLVFLSWSFLDGKCARAICTTVFDDGQLIGDVPRQPMCSDVLDFIGFVWFVWSVYVENELEW